MKYIKSRSFLFFVSLVFIVLIISLTEYINSFLNLVFRTFHFCEKYLGDVSCYHWSDITISSFLFLFSNFLFISIFLFFINQESLNRWHKFAKFFIPAVLFFVVLFVISFKPTLGGTWGGVPSFNGMHIFIPPIIFTLVSLFKFFKNRKSKIILYNT